MQRESLSIATSGRGLTDITQALNQLIQQSGQSQGQDPGQEAGLCHVFIRHTSASLIISENADPDVLADLETFLGELVPDGDPRYLHQAEGPDDMPAHVRNMLTASELTLPVQGGRLDLGTWQGVYLYEHRHRPHQRRLTITLW